MPVTRTLVSPVNATVLAREASQTGLRTGVVVDEDGTTTTFLDTTDEAAVDKALAAYDQAMTERNAIVNAFKSNQDYLALASPTGAQTTAQVQALTRQMNGLVKLLNRRGLLD